MSDPLPLTSNSQTGSDRRERPRRQLQWEGLVTLKWADGQLIPTAASGEAPSVEKPPVLSGRGICCTHRNLPHTAWKNTALWLGRLWL